MDIQVSVYFLVVILVLAVKGTVAANTEAAGEECRIARCSHHEPEIRFLFQVKDRQPEHCGHPGFQVSCHREKTFLKFQYLANTSLQAIQLFLSEEVAVNSINYTSQEMVLDFSRYLTKNLTLVSMSMLSPYAIVPDRYEGRNFHESETTFLSSPSGVIGESTFVTSLGGQAFPVYYFQDTGTGQPSIASCTKVFNSSLPFHLLAKFWMTYIFSWSAPNCGKCEAKGKYCKLMKNNASSNIETANHSTICLSRDRRQGSVKPIAGIIPGTTSILLALVVLLYCIIRSYRQKKYNELKIEMFLTDYKTMKPTRYSYGDIKKITGQFSDKLGQGGYGSVYKGQITNDIIVAVKVLNSDPKANGEEFINEVGTIGRIYHVNVVSLVGYCADSCYRALVYEFQPNSSLEKFTYSGKNHKNNFLGREKMQEIALGIAKGIDYLHEGCAHQILHFDVKPHNILLDQNFNPKISDFGLAKLCSKNQSIVSMTMARGTNGYIAPEVFSRNFGKVSSKSTATYYAITFSF